MICALCQI
jgi:hypothetical protein